MPVLQEKICRVVETRWFMYALTLLACISTGFSLEHYAIPLFILLDLLILMVSPNFLNILLPILLVNALAFRTAGQDTILLKHIWLAVPVIIFLILHFVFYRRRPVLGKSFWPLVAVSGALLVGGLGNITAEEYFDFSALYYVFFLGIGMIFFYLWMRSHIFSTDSYDAKERIMEILCLMGVYCAFIIWEHAFRTLIFFGEMQAPVAPNDLATLVLFAIPAAFYFAVRNYKFLLLGFVFYFSIVPTRSLSALLFGAVLMVFCLWYIFCFRPERRFLTVVITLSCFLTAMALAGYAGILTEGGIKHFFMEEQNGRLTIFKQYVEAFLQNPIFGGGIGQRFDGTSFMSIHWAHNYFLQILGSMGLVGIAAFGYQLVVRARLIFARIDPFRMAAALSYLGIFLNSMLQPGEFCPMPYELLAVCLFVFLEMTERDDVPVLRCEKNTV